MSSIQLQHELAHLGESERKLRETFEAAESTARAGRAAVIFLDEVDALCPRRDAQHQHESRVVAQLLTLMDGASTQEGMLLQRSITHNAHLGHAPISVLAGLLPSTASLVWCPQSTCCSSSCPQDSDL